MISSFLLSILQTSAVGCIILLNSFGRTSWGVEIDRATQSIKVSTQDSQWASRLIELYGVGEWTALLIIGKTGDIGRFPSAKHLYFYAGLVLSIHISGNAPYTGHITKQGSKWLRWPWWKQPTTPCASLLKGNLLLEKPNFFMDNPLYAPGRLAIQSSRIR